MDKKDLVEITRDSFYVLEINNISKSIIIFCSFAYFFSFFFFSRYVRFYLQHSNSIQCAKLPTHAVAYEAHNNSYIHTRRRS